MRGTRRSAPCRPPLASVLPCVLLAAGTLSAQATDPAASTAPAVAAALTRLRAPTPIVIDRVPIHTAEPDHGSEYGIWAAADSYKVGFGGDVEFVPYLGTDYPENQPLSWRTESVAVGGMTLVDGATRRERWHDEFRYEFRFGAVTEAYDVLAEGLEQTFTIHERPPSTGELTIVGRLSTPLRAAAIEREHRGITFVDARGESIVHYGAATAIDAAGHTAEALTSHADGRITLTVPAAWLADAAYPVVVDPLWTRRTVSAGLPHSSTDVARNDTLKEIMAVHARGASALDQDVYVYMMDDDFSHLNLVWSEVTTSWHTLNPRCAAAGKPQKFCAVVERRFAALGASRTVIRYHLRNGGDRTFSTAYLGFDPAVDHHDSNPDIGGHAVDLVSPTGGEFLVAYDHDILALGFPLTQSTPATSVRARIIDYNGNAGPEVIVSASGQDNELPSVSQLALRPASGPSQWMVVWQNYDWVLVLDDWDVKGRLVLSDRTVSATEWIAPNANNPLDDRKHPQVAGQSGRYLVAFQHSVSGGGGLTTIRVDWPGAGAAPVARPERVIRSTGYPTACAYDHDTASHWTIVSTAGSAANLDRVGFNGLPTESLVLGNGNGSGGAVGHGAYFDPDSDAVVLSWFANGITGTGYVNKFLYTPAPLRNVSGTSCASSAIVWFGSEQIGSEFSGVRVLGGAPQSPAALLIALGTFSQGLDPIGMTGCRLLVPNSGPQYVGTVNGSFDASGTASFVLPLPEVLPTLAIHFQAFHVQPGANPLGVISTRRLRVGIVK